MSWTPWIGLEPINNVGIQFLGDPGKRMSRMSNDHRAASVGSNTMIQLIGRYPCTFAYSPTEDTPCHPVKMSSGLMAVSVF